jgi:hypothetical protein
MSEYPFREALDECTEQIASGVKVLDAAALATFISYFEADFAQMLSHERGDVVWRRDGARLKYMGRVLGSFADFVATAERGNGAKVGLEDFRRALKAIKPYCRVPEEEVDEAKRRIYCRSVDV